MFISKANGQGKCFECEKAIERGSKQMIVTVKNGQFYSDKRLCYTCAMFEIQKLTKALNESAVTA